MTDRGAIVVNRATIVSELNVQAQTPPDTGTKDHE